MAKYAGLRLGIVLVFWLMLWASAWAEGFGLYEYSARGLALGGATIARKPDPSSVAYNPALLTRLPGTHMMLGLTSVTPAGNMNTKKSDGSHETTKLEDSTWFLPHAYFTHQINDRFTFGIGEFSRFGLGFEYPENWPGRYNIYSVSLLTASLNPNLALKVNDKLSLAAGLEAVYVNLDLQKRIPVQLPAPLNGRMDVDSNIQDARDLGFGFNLGAHYQFNEQWAVGMAYRSKVEAKSYGDVDFSGREYVGDPQWQTVANQAFADRFTDGSVHATVTLPDSAAMGIAYTPIPELSIEVGTIWTRWSTFKNLRIHLPGNMGVSESRKEWKDSWRINAGVEYQALDWLALRAGYVHDQSPMTEGYEDYLVPTDDRNIYSLGLGFNWDNWGLDLAYAYIDANGRNYTGRLSGGVNEAKSYGHSNLFSMSVSYEF